LDGGRPKEHNKHAREDKENEGQQHLYGQLCGQLLRFQSTSGAHEIGMHPKGLTDTGPKPVRLH
jgi:hypothetical protein